MKELNQSLRSYVAGRADLISENESDLLVTRSLVRREPRGRLARHGLHAAAAIVLSLLLIASGIAVEAQLHGLRFGTPTPSAGPLPTIPNEIVNLDNVQQGSDIVTPFRLKDRKLLDPRPRWIVAPGTAIMIMSGGLCDLTVIHVVDLGSPPQDARQPVSLRDCYTMPTIIPNSTLVLLGHRVNSADQKTARDMGTVIYDWSAGRVVRNYPDVSMRFINGLVSSDGTFLYTLDPYSQLARLQITNLTTGAIVARPGVEVPEGGLNAGGIALSPDGRTVYVNEGVRLSTFDARTGVAGPVVEFKETRKTSAWPAAAPGNVAGWLMSLLPSTSAEAKERVEPGHGLAVDPRGRWVAAIGVDDPTSEGIWVFDTSGSIRLARHVNVVFRASRGGWRGIAASLDGSVLYALETEPQQGAIDVIDPHTGQMRKLVKPQFSDILGIAGVESNSP